MNGYVLSFLSLLAGAPFLAIVVIFAHYHLRRARWRHGKRRGRKNLGFYPSSTAMGSAFQFLQVLWQPSVAYVMEAREEQEEDADDDESGDPDSPVPIRRQLHRQLGRIRRGEPIDRLVLRI